MNGYCGRIAPTPTGLLHLGHAATFHTAWRRARSVGGRLVLRIEDLDPVRCSAAFATAAIEDLAWLGIEWDGEPVFQSQRRTLYLDAWKLLRAKGLLYPCARSRRDVAAFAPHADEPVFPPAWRSPDSALHCGPEGINWRFRVPDGEVLHFHDARVGRVERIAGVDFGDFVVWNREDVPAYELAVSVDDLAMGITEIVRGEDLLTSTARQMLIHRALGLASPATFHCPLLRDPEGRRLSKRTNALAIRTLRESGMAPQDVLARLAHGQV